MADQNTELGFFSDKKPTKSILKTSSSFDQTKSFKSSQLKWDEMNIMQTLHPSDKDYGYMKVDEPKTPFGYYTDETSELSDQEIETLDPELLARKINLSKDTSPRTMTDDSSDEDNEIYLEEKVKSKAFEYKRKLHYNEYYAVKLARKLMAKEKDVDEDDDKDDTDECCTSENSAKQKSS